MQFNNLFLHFVYLLEMNLIKWYSKIKKEEFIVKKIEKVILTASKKLAITSLKRDANTTTCAAVYQPKAPKALKKFSKFDK